MGSAPLRNRVRRRLRALTRAHAADLVPGWYLIGADASFARSPFAAAETQFRTAVRAAAEASGIDVSPGESHEGLR